MAKGQEAAVLQTSGYPVTDSGFTPEDLTQQPL